MNKEEFQELLDKVKINLIHRHPFYGTVLASMNIIAADMQKVVGSKVRGATDCYKNIWIDTDLNQTPQDIFAVLLHELHHVICLHSIRRKNRSPMLWNMATDYAINPMIKEAGYELPLDSLYDERFRNLTAEEIYNILKKGNPQQEEDDPGSQLFDVLVSPRVSPDVAEERVKEVIIKAYIIHKKYGRGTLPGGIKEIINEIIDPKIPFEDILPRYTTRVLAGKAEYSFSPVKKRYALEYDAVFPTISREEAPFVIVVIDTSGSISTEDLKIFAGGLKRISALTPEVMVVTHDVSVQQVIRTNKIEEFLNKLEFRGRGGTSHIPVFNWIMDYAKKVEPPDMVICFTDGYSEFPKKKPPFHVAWVINNSEITPPWGKVLRLYGMRKSQIR